MGRLQLRQHPMLSHGLAPISSNHATTLILGSMPGAESIRQQQYYAHPRNAFWYIIEKLIDIDAQAPYSERIAQLSQSHIALWDVVASCHRPGSLDNNISADSIKLNPIDQFISTHPTVKCIGLNGSKAFELFERHFIKTQKLPKSIQYIQLPSTSPAHARLNKAQKYQLWQDRLKAYT